MASSRTPEVDPTHAEARILSGLWNKTTCVRLVWSTEDFGPMLRHQLATRLSDDLLAQFPDAREAIAEAGAMTFGELLLHPCPPIGALRLVKDFAKLLNRQAYSAYPEDVATVLYYASIAAAALHARTALTSLPREEMRRGLRWAAEREWIPEDVRHLFMQALEERA